MTEPFFSVVIPTYNRAKLLTKALDSLISQTIKDWEAIIVDDESTDNTYAHITRYLILYPQIRYFRKTHSGCAVSKNAGICLSAGKFITFLDSDDEYKANHLELRKELLTADTSIEFLYGGVKVIGNQYVPDRFDHSKSVSLNDCVIGGTFFVKRNAIFRLSGFREISFGEDADLYERAKKAGIIMKKTNSPTYIYHHETEDSITNRLHVEHTIKRLSEVITAG
jgi:glycosyltransferase involved in cell wall biosynthesis